MVGRRSIVLATSALGAAFATLPMVIDLPVRMVFNPSPSAPRGLYAAVDFERVELGDLLLVEAPRTHRNWLIGRGYLGPEVPLIKRVAALPGDRVCARNRVILVNQRPLATALHRDGLGRPLPIWQGCRALLDGEFFALMTDVPTSLDSRYFGPLRTDTIIAKLRPLWLLD